MSVAQISGKYGKILFIIQFSILRKKKCSVSFPQSRASTPRLLSYGRRATNVLFKEPDRARKHGVSIPHSYLPDDFNLLMKSVKTSFTR